MSFNLVFFNGDVRRDKKQEAMIKSLNERDNFLNRLREMEHKREKDEKQEKAARKVQKFWRGHRVQHNQRLLFRAEFDAVSDRQRGLEVRVLLLDDIFCSVNKNSFFQETIKMAQLLVNFYETNKDEERLVMTLSELVKLKTSDKEFEKRIRETQRLLLARCCIKFLKNATENTIFFHIFR